LSLSLNLPRLGRGGGLLLLLFLLEASGPVRPAENLASPGANVAFAHEEFSVVGYFAPPIFRSRLYCSAEAGMTERRPMRTSPRSANVRSFLISASGTPLPPGRRALAPRQNDAVALREPGTLASDRVAWGLPKRLRIFVAQGDPTRPVKRSPLSTSR